MCVRAAGRGLEKPGGNERASIRAGVMHAFCACVIGGVYFGSVHQLANK